MRSFKPLLRTLLVTSALGLSLGACREDDLLRGAAAALPATMALQGQGYPQGVYDPYADPYARVPIGRPVSYDDAWAWGERSYALDRAFYETPPDYGFDYDGVEPWVWQTDDRWAMYADPYADDDYRYYYYEPGDTRPYFIRDDNYGYGFDDVGRLVVIYDLLGRIMPQSLLYQQDPIATDYYRRAYDLRRASLHAQPVVINQQIWVTQAPIIVQDQSRWIQAATTQQPWVQYRTRTKDQFVRAFDDERQRRQRETVVASQDRDGGFLGLPIGRRSERREAPSQVARLDERRRDIAQVPAPNVLPEQRRAERQMAQGPRADRQMAEERQVQLQQRQQDQSRHDQARFEQQAREQGRQQQQVREQARQQQHVQQLAREQDRQQQQVREQARQQQHAQQQARDEARQQQHTQQQAREQARQQQQAREQERQQQHAQQQARDEARQQQHAQQQAREQARQQQQAQQQAREQAGQQQQAREQARQQQEAQQQAREQARQQQQAQQQAREQARQQQQAQQQAREQARQQQQAQQQARAQEQQAAQPHGRNAAAAPDNGGGQAAPAEHGKGKGHNK